MKIEEAKEKIEKLQTLTVRDELINGFHSELIDKSNVLNIINQLDQPKPVVPQYVADWYEEHKDKLEEELCYQIWVIRESGAETDFEYWLTETENPIQTLINMHQFSYTVEKEKLYTVEIPNPNLNTHTILQKTGEGLVLVTVGNARWKGWESSKLTESEIKEDFDFLWQFAKPVEVE